MTPDELVQREEIRELLARYCQLHAAHDFAGVAALFADDGCFENIVGLARGRAAIQRVYESINPDAGSQLERKHFTTDVILTLADNGRATAISQFLLVRQQAGGLMAAAAGRYEDSLVCTAEGWRFARRQVHVDFHSDMGLKPRDAETPTNEEKAP